MKKELAEKLKDLVSINPSISMKEIKKELNYFDYDDIVNTLNQIRENFKKSSNKNNSIQKRKRIGIKTSG